MSRAASPLQLNPEMVNINQGRVHRRGSVYLLIPSRRYLLLSLRARCFSDGAAVILRCGGVRKLHGRAV